MSNENNNKESSQQNDSLIDKNNNLSGTKESKNNLILPSLKNNYMTIQTNQNESKVAFDTMKKYDKDLKDSFKSRKKGLNKSTSIPNIRAKEFDKIKENYPKNIYNYSNRILDKRTVSIKSNRSKNFESMRTLNRAKKIKKNFFMDKIKYIKKLELNKQSPKDSRNSKENDIINSTKNINTNDETSKEVKTINNPITNQSKSTIFKISKINLNQYPLLKLKNAQDKKRKAFRSLISTIPKYSEFFHKSQSDSIGAQTIYKYYLNKSASEITLPVNNFNIFFQDKTHTAKEKLKRIYCENKNFDALMRELKDNKKIAYKNDFDIEEYQNILLEILEKRVSQKNLINLQDEYRELNKKIFSVFEPKGRFTFLAEKLRYNLPSFLLEKFKQLDKDSIMSRMNYYNQFKYFKNDKKLEIKFGRQDDKNKKNKSKKNKEEI